MEREDKRNLTTDGGHGNRGGGPLHVAATVDVAGFMSAADKAALDAISSLTALADPNADRVIFWDDSAGAYAFLTMGTNLSITGTTLNASGLSDGDKGDITVSGSGATLTIDNNAVTNAKLAQVATATIKGRTTAATGDVEDLTAAQARGVLGLATTDSPEFAAVNVGAATDTTITRASAGRLAVEGVSVVLSTDVLGQETIWMPAVGMASRTTNGAATGSSETTTHKVMRKSLDFDTTTQEFAQFAIQMPKGWDEGTLICQFVWGHAATTTDFGVVWAIEAVAFADDDAADTAFGTAVQAADTGGTTDDIYISPETSAMTVAGSPAAEEWVVFQVKRVPTDGSDTMAIDARLYGVKVHYTINAATDD